jgi:DNA helicase-2/ATP-dependent DNA helicase PcrA
VVVQNKEELHQNVIEQIKRYKEAGHQTIAVICKTALESRAAYEALKMTETVRLIEKGTITFETGVVVIPAYLAKGIEFDAVIIYDCSQYTEESERKLFYTACTRAMHELHLTSVGQLSPLMTNVSPQKYKLVCI